MNKISCTEEDDWAKLDFYQTVLQFLQYNVHLLLVFYHDDSTPWPAISYIDGFLMSALSSMLELVVSVECNCSCSIVMEFLNIWCVYCFIWWNKEESQKTVYFILILFLSLSDHKSVESSLYPHSFSNPHQVPAMSLLSTSNNISRENHQTEGS